MIRQVYYEEKDLKRIIHYFKRDVITLAQVFLRLRNEELLTEDEIISVSAYFPNFIAYNGLAKLRFNAG